MFPVEAFEATLTKAVEILDELSIRFHLTGGVTSIVYGEPRLTQDIDLVIDQDMTRSQLESLLVALADSDFLHDEPAIREAVSAGRVFQLLDTVEALKLDIYPRELIPGELSRSIVLEIFEGVKLPVASRADAAVSKLIWVTRGSHKSRRDLRQIFRSCSASEQAAVREMCATLNLSGELDEVLRESDEPIE